MRKAGQETENAGARTRVEWTASERLWRRWSAETEGGEGEEGGEIKQAARGCSELLLLLSFFRVRCELAVVPRDPNHNCTSAGQAMFHPSHRVLQHSARGTPASDPLGSCIIWIWILPPSPRLARVPLLPRRRDIVVVVVVRLLRANSRQFSQGNFPVENIGLKSLLRISPAIGGMIDCGTTKLLIEQWGFYFDESGANPKSSHGTKKLRMFPKVDNN